MPHLKQASTATIYAHRYDRPNDERYGTIGGLEVIHDGRGKGILPIKRAEPPDLLFLIVEDLRFFSECAVHADAIHLIEAGWGVVYLVSPGNRQLEGVPVAGELP